MTQLGQEVETWAGPAGQQCEHSGTTPAKKALARLRIFAFLYL